MLLLSPATAVRRQLTVRRPPIDASQGRKGSRRSSVRRSPGRLLGTRRDPRAARRPLPGRLRRRPRPRALVRRLGMRALRRRRRRPSASRRREVRRRRRCNSPPEALRGRRAGAGGPFGAWRKRRREGSGRRCGAAARVSRCGALVGGGRAGCRRAPDAAGVPLRRQRCRGLCA